MDSNNHSASLPKDTRPDPAPNAAHNASEQALHAESGETAQPEPESEHSGSIPSVSIEAANDVIDPGDLGTLAPNVEHNAEEMADDKNNDDDAGAAAANTSVTLHPSSSVGRAFATPLKLLPPLKDIESITTPKSFSVAKDEQPVVGSSPVVQHKSSQLEDLAETNEDAFDQTANDTFANVLPVQPSHDVAGQAEIEAAASFVGVDASLLVANGETFVAKLAQRAHQYQGLQSELSFFKLNQEQINLVQLKKFEALQKRLDRLSSANNSLTSENESFGAEAQKKDALISDLRKQVSQLTEKNYQLENVTKQSESTHLMSIGSKDQELFRLNEIINKMTKTSVEQGQRLSELTKELNNVTNEKFSNKLELSKVSNELSYIKKQKDWYEQELSSVQDKYTELIKKHDSEFLKDSIKIDSLTTQNENLETLKLSLTAQVKELESKLEKQSSRAFDLENKLEVQSLKISKESSAKEDVIELLKLQSSERESRIAQLEEYSESLKSSTAESIGALQQDIAERDDRIAYLEEQLKRMEEVLDNELHKDPEHPRLAQSAEIILQNNSLGISLSSLYTEFNHVKKELVLERSQKEKLSNQLQHFVAELESKKPAIANYRNQILFYENSLKELLATLDSVRGDKIESDRESNRLRTRLASYEIELQSVKQLSKDLGRQLCYYLIHSKIRDGNQDPLSSQEKRVIEQIMTRSNNKDTTIETDTDQLITERLVGFASIIELQQKNEELISAVRLLGKQLEDKDKDSNGYENAAVEEARDAILTLQSELDSANLKLEAATKERDLMKSFTGNSHNGDSTKAEVKVLLDSNNDLRRKAEDTENALKALQSQSSEKLKSLNAKLTELSKVKEDLQLKNASARHAVEMAESRLDNTKKLLESARTEIEHSRREAVFWKEQAAKQEDLLVKKSNELRDCERKLARLNASSENLTTEKEVWQSLKESLRNEIGQLKADKDHLNLFVSNLQSILKERESSGVEMSKKLTQSIENYHSLQAKILEKDERILILSSQSDMALKAQNAKLEQVNELSQKLLDVRGKLSEKESQIAELRSKLKEAQKSKPATREITSSVDFENKRMVLASEYEDLKNEYKLAESQVAEFSNIAKGAENALMAATESFDQFKAVADETRHRLQTEKDDLAKQVEELQATAKELQTTLSSNEAKYSSEIRELTEKVHEYSLKAAHYDELKRDYDSKFAALNSDLQSQVSVNDDLEKRYQSILSSSELINRQLSAQKESNASLIDQVEKLSADVENTKSELKMKEIALADLASDQKEELEAARIKIRDMEYQYNLAINQLELLQNSGASASEDADENMREVIAYLRREKEAAEAKVNLLTEERSMSKSQLDSLSTELNAAKSQIARLQSVKMELHESNQEHSRMLERLEQINILRESNSTLRLENKTILDRAEALQAEVDKLKSHKPEATTEDVNGAVQQQELDLLKEENERLKTQLSSNEEVKNLLQRFENLKTEFRTKLMGHRTKNKELEKELSDIKASLEHAQNELAAEKANGGANGEATQLKTQLSNANNEKQDLEKRLTDEIKTLKEDFEKQKSAAKSAFDAQLKKALEGKSGEASDGQLRQQLENEYQEKLDKTTKELTSKFEADANAKVEQRVNERLALGDAAGSGKDAEEVRKEVTQQYEQKIKELTTCFEKKIVQEKADVEKAVDKKYEFKLRVLNRKVEKLEKDQSGNQGKPQPKGGANANQQHKGGKGHQFTENTLTVSRPQGGNNNNGEGGNNKKRAANNPPEVNFKRTKE